MNRAQLTVHNASRYPTETVERLVRFALEPLEVNNARVFVHVRDGGHRYLWQADPLDGGADAPRWLKPLVPARTRFVFLIRVGHSVRFPSKRHRSWCEAVVAAAGYAARWAQDEYDGEPFSRHRCRAWQQWSVRRLRDLGEDWTQPASAEIGPIARPAGGLAAGTVIVN